MQRSDRAYASNPPLLDKNLHPIGSGMQMGTFAKTIPYVFSIKQKLNVKDIVASSLYAKNLVVSGAGTVPLTGGTLADYFYNVGTVANSLIEGGTINTSIWEGGTINGITSEGGTMNNGVYANGVLGTPAITGGTWKYGILGTPTITGGLINAGTYETNGTAGASGSIIYVKTVNPGTTFGTLNFNNGLITSFS